METRKIPHLRDDYYLDNKNKHSNSNKNSSKDNPSDYINNNDTTTTNNKRLIGETRLVHVTAIVRHGARTPWSNQMKCWDGFWNSSETGVWDCDDLTTFMTSPSRNETGISSTTKTTIPVDPAFFLFEKRYDALHFPRDGLTNILNGTCQMGQLLQQGYDQQIKNGKLIREAYTYRKGDYDHDERMRLLDVSLEEYVPWHPDILYFRADDDQRTVMSGQVLLRGLFDPELIKTNHINKNIDGNSDDDDDDNNKNNNNNHIVVVPLHIADRDRDILDANSDECPKLDTIKDAAIRSPQYQKFNNSQESQDVRQFMDSQLGMDSNDASPMDCLMCTICTDRLLPIDDYNTTTNNWFTRLIEYEIQQHTIPMKYNNAEWAKLALGPLWYEIMKNINASLKEDDDDVAVTAPRLALFAGHDTTLMPLLASLGPNLWNDTGWPPYASMILIEIHELIDGRSDPEIYTSRFAFRLIYNGKILTSLVDGCHEHSELCDIIHFKSKLDPIATRDKDCSTTIIPDATDIEDVTTNSNSGEPPFFLSLSTTMGIIVFITMIVLSGFLGSVFTFLIMRRFRYNKIYDNSKRVDYGNAWDMNDDDDDNIPVGSLEMREGRFRDEPEHETK